jgi:hypothetical protein
MMYAQATPYFLLVVLVIACSLQMEVLVKEREDRISDLEGRADKLAKEVRNQR